MADEIQAPVEVEQQFDAYTIIASDKYKRYRDLLSCLLEEDVMYTHSDIDKILNQALNQLVKG